MVTCELMQLREYNRRQLNKPLNDVFSYHEQETLWKLDQSVEINP